MRFSPLFAVVIFLLISPSCKELSNNKSLEIADQNFQKEIDPGQNLNLVFNRDLAPDSLLDIWMEKAYISFDPPCEGRYKWLSVNELSFSPSQPFNPNTDFTARLEPAILEYMGDEISLGKSCTFAFHTPRLNLENFEVFWNSGEDNSMILEASLAFNYPVEPKEVKDKISIVLDGRKYNTELITNESDKLISFAVINYPTGMEDIKAELNLSAGLGSPGGNWKTQEKVAYTTEVPSRDKLEIRYMKASHSGLSGSVRLVTTQPVDPSELEKYLSFSPKVKYRIEQSHNGMTLISDEFNVERVYNLNIGKKLQGLFGGKMTDDYAQKIAFGKLKPSIQFSDEKSRYLGSKGNRNLGINITSVPEITVTITKVFENNIIHFGRQGRSYDWYYDDSEDNYYDYTYYDTRNYGNKIYEETIATYDLPKNGNARLLNLDFEDKIGRFPGIYVINVSASEKTWLNTSKVVSVSDIGLIARYSGDEVLVFANSIQTAEALANVDITFISTTNQALITLKTDNEGVAKFASLKQEAKGFDIGLITAKTGDDFNYLSFSESGVETSRFDLGGHLPNDADLDVFIYGERDLYRPGETMNLCAIVRKFDWSLPGNLPMQFKVILPNGRTLKSIRKSLSDQGAMEASVELPATAMTGNYTVEVYTANDVLLGSSRISVEEFMPDRIRILSELDKEEVRNGDDISVNFTALNLYGPPAAGRNYETELSLRRMPFSAKDYPDYTFNPAFRQYFDRQGATGKTADDGSASETFTIDPEYKDMGLLEGKILLTVFDETGRPVYKTNTFEILTQDIFYGIKMSDRYVGTDIVMDLPIIAVNKEGVALENVDAKVEIIKYEWETVVEKYGNSFRYVSQKKERVMVDDQISISGDQSAYSYTPRLSGQYEMRISRPGAENYTSVAFYAYNWASTEYNAFEVDKDGNVDIVFDKEEYEVGDDAEILFKTPFNGKLLVTLERDRVYRHFYLKADKRSTSIKFEIPDTYVPNMYITATLIRPSGETSLPLTVAHGYASMPVGKKSNKLAVEIKAESASRSKTRQKISIKTAPNASFTIAAVDEGILQIKNYKTPDPYEWFYSKRALAVESFDLYAWLFPELIAKKLLSGGGDGMIEMDQRANPLGTKRVKLTSFWSGILQADDKGKAEFEIDIPEFSGELRLMAAAWKNEKFGSAESSMKVADPIVLSTALPRFLSPGDSLIVPVTIANTTDAEAGGSISIETTGPVKIRSAGSGSFKAGANKETSSTFKIYAENAIGEASVKIKADALGETFSQIIEIPVRPAAGLQKITGADFLAAGKSLQLDMSNNFLASGLKTKLVLSNSPAVQFTDDLEYLIRYPYGCVEQTVSSAFPQIYFDELVRDLLTDENTDINPGYNVQEAINRLQTMQMYNGALSYWPGSGYESWWGTAYATHFLMEAGKAGFEVNRSVVKKMVGYLKNMLKSKKTYVYRYNQNESREIAPREVPYSMYVLALMGEPDISSMNYYKANPNLLSLDGKYLLAVCYALAGDYSRFETMLPAAFEGEIAEPQSGGSFSSHLRDEALALNALLEANPDHPQVAAMARHISTQMNTRRYLNTQERAFGFLALGKIAMKQGKGDMKADVMADGKKIGTYDGKNLLALDGENLNGKAISMTTSGTGSLYYFWELEGVSADGSYREEDNFMRVRKTFFDRNGTALPNLMNLHQNDLIVVKVSVVGPGNSEIENVAVADILPAGFEIENSRLREVPDFDWIKNVSEPDYEDIRDDRITWFTTVTGNQKNFYYAVRAVSPGTFRMGPVMADAMYMGEYHSYHGAGTVRILR